jgi:hypothetical protein
MYTIERHIKCVLIPEILQLSYHEETVRKIRNMLTKDTLVVNAATYSNSREKLRQGALFRHKTPFVKECRDIY